MQVGDVVRVIDGKQRSKYHAFDVGTEVRIECIDPNDSTLWGCRAVDPTAYIGFQWVYDHDLEPLEAKSEVDQWFDEKLAEPKKKERVPDELDWEKHKAFMRSLR